MAHLNHSMEGPQLAVVRIYAYFARHIIRSVPQVDISIEGSAFRSQYDLYFLHGSRAVTPGAEGPTVQTKGSWCLW